MAGAAAKSDAILAVPDALRSKKQQLPIKKLRPGQPFGKAVNRGAMAHPVCVDGPVALAAERAAAQGSCCSDRQVQAQQGEQAGGRQAGAL